VSIRSVAAQRATGKGPSLVVPKGSAVLPRVAPKGDPARNDHKSNRGGGAKGLSGGKG
jgi:hypothetical protein